MGITLTVIACGGADDSESEDSAEPGTGHVEVREVVIVSSDQLSFEPSTVTVKAGQHVMIVFDNSDAQAPHDFTIDEMHVLNLHAEGGIKHMDGDEGGEADVQIAAAAGEKAVIEFTPEEPGEYAFYCSVVGHREGGMEGLLIVE